MIVIVLLQRTIEYYIEWLHFTMCLSPVLCRGWYRVSEPGLRLRVRQRLRD